MLSLEVGAIPKVTQINWLPVIYQHVAYVFVLFYLTTPSPVCLMSISLLEAIQKLKS
jgi:putative exporter of polyketide antibiotics